MRRRDLALARLRDRLRRDLDRDLGVRRAGTRLVRSCRRGERTRLRNEDDEPRDRDMQHHGSEQRAPPAEALRRIDVVFARFALSAPHADSGAIDALRVQRRRSIAREVPGDASINDRSSPCIVPTSSLRSPAT